MKENRGLEPRLVMMDNLGAAVNSPAPYSLLWWLKQIYVASGGGATGVPVDVRSTGFITLNNSTFTDILVYNLASGETLSLGEVLVSLQGAFAHFIIEYDNGTTTTNVREYLINQMNPTFPETFKQDIPLAYVGAGSKITIKAKMIGVGQTGKGYGALNGNK